MPHSLSRREALKQIGTAGAGVVLAGSVLRGQRTPIRIAGMPVEVAVSFLGPHTVRLTAAAIAGTGGVPEDGALVQAADAKPLARGRDVDQLKAIKSGNLVV